MRILPFMGNWDGWAAATGVWATVLSLLMLLALLVYRQRTVWREGSIMLVMMIVTGGLHLKFARLGWFFRYEAYLIALSLVVFAIGAFQYLSDRRGRESNRIETMLAGGWLGYTLLLPLMVLGSRGYISLSRIPRASHNIFEQQYQMGLFVRQFYRGAPVAANDIGAVSYLGEPRLEDLWGLASLDVARLRMQGEFTPRQIDQITRSKGTKIAMVYDLIFRDGRAARGGLPAQWIQVGRWKVFDDYVCAGDTVSFYAVDPSEEKALITHLRQFASRLPPEVEQSGKYRQPD